VRLLNSDWITSAPPVLPAAAYTVRVGTRVVHQLAERHDIQLGVASVLIRPMLDDLIRSGTWSFQIASRQYRLNQGPWDGDFCHAFTWIRARTDLAEVTSYAARHPDSHCPDTEPPAVPALDTTWLPHFQDAHQPPPDRTDPWRAVLRVASTLPLTIIKPALDSYSRYGPGLGRLTPANFAPAFFDMAREARHVRPQWRGIGNEFINDSTGLIWSVAPSGRLSEKPVVTSVLPPRGVPADNPAHQRARRAKAAGRAHP
jgi:hypothetical protein